MFEFEKIESKDEDFKEEEEKERKQFFLESKLLLIGK